MRRGEVRDGVRLAQQFGGGGVDDARRADRVERGLKRALIRRRQAQAKDRLPAGSLASARR
ncbi:MAG: hypothetical protein R3F11_24960 [Verrucomicrobiales bacterium]